MELVMIAVGLSMDACAVAMCKGLCMRKINYVHALMIALFFGAFQGIMPLLGWLMGSQFDSFMHQIDHWIAFVLLGYIGGKMIWDARHENLDEGAARTESKLDLKELFMLSLATSIDALAVGVSFGFLHVAIAPAAAVIASVTFALSFLGVIVGNRFGMSYEKKAQIAGGIVLILIGTKILLEHLGLLPF